KGKLLAPVWPNAVRGREGESSVRRAEAGRREQVSALIWETSILSREDYSWSRVVGGDGPASRSGALSPGMDWLSAEQRDIVSAVVLAIQSDK
ncbi:9382_t:CDS:2, partial [Acaulospora colombiana]